jgi:hypothetical protein
MIVPPGIGPALSSMTSRTSTTKTRRIREGDDPRHRRPDASIPSNSILPDVVSCQPIGFGTHWKLEAPTAHTKMTLRNHHNASSNHRTTRLCGFAACRYPRGPLPPCTQCVQDIYQRGRVRKHKFVVKTKTIFSNLLAEWSVFFLLPDDLATAGLADGEERWTIFTSHRIGTSGSRCHNNNNPFGWIGRFVLGR